MLALAGYPLGLDFLFFDRSVDTPAGRVAPLLAGAHNAYGHSYGMRGSGLDRTAAVCVSRCCCKARAICG